LRHIGLTVDDFVLIPGRYAQLAFGEHSFTVPLDDDARTGPEALHIIGVDDRGLDQHQVSVDLVNGPSYRQDMSAERPVRVAAARNAAEPPSATSTDRAAAEVRPMRPRRPAFSCRQNFTTPRAMTVSPLPPPRTRVIGVVGGYT
jgi:hypothetical protein